MINIKDEYISSEGNKYKLKNINYESIEDIRGNLGTYITETKRNVNNFFSEDDNIVNGVYIYKSNYDPNKALRIYKDWADYKFNCHSDYKIIAKLQELQKNVTLTDFPTGIVTLENSVIGQEIKLYEGYVTLSDYLCNKNNIKNILSYCRQILIIIKELYNNGIIYKDIHLKNFMIKDHFIKLIDFDESYISFGESLYCYKMMISNLKSMLGRIENILNINLDITNADSLEQIEELILKKSI